MSIFMKILLSFIQLFWVLVVAPLLAGVIQKTKALLQGRIGPRLFQPYYDLAKFFRKSAVFSEHTSWLTRLTPYIVITTTIVASMFIPFLKDGFFFTGDIILFIYLLGMGRFFSALAALDTGSSFGGMGASREMSLNTVIEPAFVLAIIAIIIQTGTTSFSQVLTILSSSEMYVSLPYILSLLAMFLVILGETGRIPVDNVDTHLELTMIHEGMLLEYSGRYYSLMSYHSMIKQFIFIGLFVVFYLPFFQVEITSVLSGLGAIVILTVKILLVGIVVAFVEMTYAKMRLYQIPRLFVTSMTLSVLALIVHFMF